MLWAWYTKGLHMLKDMWTSLHTLTNDKADLLGDHTEGRDRYTSKKFRTHCLT